MSKTVIKFENLSKLYRLGEVGTGTISHDLNRWWRMNILGQPDPYAKVGHTNDRTAKAEKGEMVWALKDIDFEVKEGEVLGIIGKNGAGKSTLLKILSKVTSPTTGCIKVKGRIASLLEVGTGFNPEMTGRENIYMNGTIMGMRKWEIDKKFDEIVDFAGVAKYIDTPVKRYSSGMTVRLGFAVAAYLEPEILVVDEVLAVGDAEFQKKALGKMQEVSQGHGRTVLFVSHNMSAVKTLCQQGLFFKNGRIKNSGEIQKVIEQYLTNDEAYTYEKIYSVEKPFGDENCILMNARIIDSNLNTIQSIIRNQKIGIEYSYKILNKNCTPIPNMHVFTSDGTHIFFSSENEKNISVEEGIHTTRVWIPENLLNTGIYIAGIATTTMIPYKIHFFDKEALRFEILENINERIINYSAKLPGIIRPNLIWNTFKAK